MDDPTGSRLFIVCGKSVEAETLEVAFKPFGNVQNVKVIRDKGVAYVKYDKASSAALAMEALNGEVLNNGRGPKLKVLLAEAPTARGMSQLRPPPAEVELTTDPDNNPPRSRLFIVVPKTADANLIQEELSTFKELEYCKTDLIATKGVVFAKYAKSSAALVALESVCGKGSLAGYKVKCMLAEPKTKRARPDAQTTDLYHAAQVGYGQAGKLDYGMGLHMDHNLPLKLGVGNGFGSLSNVQGLASMGSMGSVSSLAPSLDGLGPQVSLGFMSNLGTIGNPMSPGNHHHPHHLGLCSPGAPSMSSSSSHLSNTSGYSGLNATHYSAAALTAASLSPATPTGMVSRLRLFVVVNKGVSEDVLARLFRRFPGMEYCDLKKDRSTGKSKGYAYINYSTPEAAAMAIEHLHGMEFPPHSGHRIKVMFAEPLGVRSGIRTTPIASPISQMPQISPAPSPVHTPLATAPNQFTGMADVSSVQDTLATMALQNSADTTSSSLHDVGRAIASPVPAQASQAAH